MQTKITKEVMNRLPKAVASWATTKKIEKDGHWQIDPKDLSAPSLFTSFHVADGLEVFAEEALRHEKKTYREVARQIKREQWDKISLTNPMIDDIIQFAIYGEIIY